MDFSKLLLDFNKSSICKCATPIKTTVKCLMQIESKLQTPIGEITFTASAESSTKMDFDIFECNLSNQLYNGDKVGFRTAVLLKVYSKTEINNLNFSAFIDIVNSEISYESGEFLEAYSWESDTMLATIGTEDSYALENRLNMNLITNENYSVTEENGFINISLKKLAINPVYSFHFIVSTELKINPNSISTWLAVDFPHSKIVL